MAVPDVGRDVGRDVDAVGEDLESGDGGVLAHPVGGTGQVHELGVQGPGRAVGHAAVVGDRAHVADGLGGHVGGRSLEHVRVLDLLGVDEDPQAHPVDGRAGGGREDRVDAAEAGLTLVVDDRDEIAPVAVLVDPVVGHLGRAGVDVRVGVVAVEAVDRSVAVAVRIRRRVERGGIAVVVDPVVQDLRELRAPLGVLVVAVHDGIRAIAVHVDPVEPIAVLVDPVVHHLGCAGVDERVGVVAVVAVDAAVVVAVRVGRHEVAPVAVLVDSVVRDLQHVGVDLLVGVVAVVDGVESGVGRARVVHVPVLVRVLVVDRSAAVVVDSVAVLGVAREGDRLGIVAVRAGGHVGGRGHVPVAVLVRVFHAQARTLELGRAGEGVDAGGHVVVAVDDVAVAVHVEEVIPVHVDAVAVAGARGTGARVRVRATILAVAVAVDAVAAVRLGRAGVNGGIGVDAIVAAAVHAVVAVVVLVVVDDRGLGGVAARGGAELRLAAVTGHAGGLVAAVAAGEDDEGQGHDEVGTHGAFLLTSHRDCSYSIVNDLILQTEYLDNGHPKATN